MQLSDTDYKVLELEAKAQGVSVEKLLEDLGHLLQPAPESVQPVVAAPPQPAEPAPQPAQSRNRVDVPEIGIIETDSDTDEVLIEADVMPELPPELPDEPAYDETPVSDGTIGKSCPHCGLDPSQAALAVPTRADKLFFLQCLLGDTIFKKSYDVFGGKISFAFRLLRTAELDFLYREALQSYHRGLITSTADFYTYIASLRVYVQLLSVTSQFGARNTLPDGLTVDTSPDAVLTWDKVCPEGDDDTKTTLLERVQRHINAKVLRTETVLESAKTLCDQFNALVVVLEKNKMNDPFWYEIETPP